MFRIEIKTSGAAFCNPVSGEPERVFEFLEVDRILRQISSRFLQGENGGNIIDTNGNVCGGWVRDEPD